MYYGICGNVNASLILDRGTPIHNPAGHAAVLSLPILLLPLPTHTSAFTPSEVTDISVTDLSFMIPYSLPSYSD